MSSDPLPVYLAHHAQALSEQLLRTEGGIDQAIDYVAKHVVGAPLPKRRKLLHLARTMQETFDQIEAARTTLLAAVWELDKAQS